MEIKGRLRWLHQFVFVGPAVAVFVLIIAVPLMLTGYYSMTEWNGVSGSVNWIGLGNFKQIFMEDEGFASSFLFTLWLTVAIVILTNLVGFSLAYALTLPLRSRNVLRTVFFVPNVLGGLLLGFIWKFIFVQGFGALGDLTNWPFFQWAWLGTEATAFWGIVIVSVWHNAGYMMVIYIAGLMNVPSDLKEAARIDGARPWQVMRNVTLPMVMPSITVCLFFSIAWTFKIYDVNFSLTGGGPFGSTRSVAMDIFQEAFQYNRFGLGTAKALIFFVIVALITATQVYLTKRREVEM